MRVKVRLHVGDRQGVKVEELTVELREHATLGELWQALTEQHASRLDVPLLSMESGAAQPYARGAALTIVSIEPDAPLEALSFDTARVTTLQAPLVDGFDFPVGKPDARNYYVAAGVAEMPYYQRFGFWHTGEDWNGVRGGDSDLGDPVYATAHGKVVAARFYSPSWGNTVLLEHRLAGGRTVWSQYAHLRNMFVREGEIVRRGQSIGTIGKGEGNQWPAHLHFEIRYENLPANQWNWKTMADRETVLRFYARPSTFIRSNRPGRAPDGIVVDDADPGFVRTACRYWFESNIGYGNHTFWTWTVGEQQGADCGAVWRPPLRESGLYEVFAFIPRRFATTKQAKYQITHRRGTTTVTINQSEYFDEWVSLGSYAFSTEMPASVRLSDLTGEPLSPNEADRLQIAFDAIMWSRVAGG